jgi:cobalt/nickel transport system permease protein
VKLDLDQFAAISSPFQRWDARWKLTACAVFVIATLLLQQTPTAVIALAVGLAMVLAARLPVPDVARRLKPVMLVVLAVALVLAFTGGGDLRYVWQVPLSRSGSRTAVLIGAKALAVALSLVACISTSPAHRVLAAMHQLHLPAGLVQVIHLAYRYVFLLQTESRAVQTAMKARAFRSSLKARSLSVLGNVVGMLLIRSTERAERVYLAMQARGFDGSFPIGEPWHTRGADVAKCAVLMIIALLLVVRDQICSGR